MAGVTSCGHDSEVGALHFAVLHDLVHYGARQVGRNGEADALIAFRPVRQDGGVDADQFAAVVDQRAAGVAGVNRRVGLNEVLILFDAQAGAALGADDSHGYRLADAERIAHGDGVIADARFAGIGEHDRGQVGGVDLQYRDIDLRVGSDDFGLEFALVGRGLTRISVAPSTTWLLVRI